MHEFLIDNINEAVFNIDGDGIIKYLNKSWTEITGFTCEESYDKSFLDYIHPDDRNRVISLGRQEVRNKQERHKSKIAYFIITPDI